MRFWRQVLLGLPVVALVCGVLPASVEAQFSQQGPKLVATDAIGDARQGASVALSSDGNSAIVGGYGDNDFAGASWIYMRSGGVWSEQAKLVATDAIADAAQGYSASLSGDGNSAIVGGFADNGGIGAAWVYTRSGGVWSQQTKLVATDAIGNADQGFSVSLSSDGNTAIVGGDSDNSGIGAAWVYTRSRQMWSKQAKLVGTGAIGPAAQGISVALSGDGNTAIVGGADDDNGNVPGAVGAAWVYTRSNGVWTQQAKLVGTGAIGGALQGSSVSLSNDGNTAIVGGPLDDSGSIPFSGIGAAWVYTRSNGVWSQQAKLVGAGVTGGIGAQQGLSVALSSNGNTAIVGGREDNDEVGASWVFTRSGGAWTQQGPKLVGTGVVGRANLGSAVSLSGDGHTAMVGGPSDDSNGAVWVYAEPVVFAGTPGKANCHGKSVSALAQQLGGLSAAAAALGFDSVSALQDAIMAFCGG